MFKLLVRLVMTMELYENLLRVHFCHFVHLYKRIITFRHLYKQYEYFFVYLILLFYRLWRIDVSCLLEKYCLINIIIQHFRD